ncbi:MFS transporter [Streptomyces sp. HPF1205]|uniref:MFS transporter n=1 Tax=Streptomyces sp. HPF1205 TaxID=2873262 RepID=UPI001CEDD688|nr:MFS transporter [Streptomyces sp. HPF1205]
MVTSLPRLSRLSKAAGARAGASFWRRTPPGLHPALVVQTVSYSVGQGLYLACGIIYFTLYGGLGPAQVSFGFSCAGLASLCLWMPFGVLSDRLGGRETWMLGAFGQAVLFAALPFVHGFGPFVAVITAIGLASTLGSSGRVRYLGDIASALNRVKVNAYLRSLSNIGSTLGLATGGVIVGLKSEHLVAGALWANALTFAADVVLLAVYGQRGTPRAERAERPKGRRALSDRPFVVLSLVTGVFAASDIVLTLVLPLWILQRTDAPRFVISAMMAVNTGMVILLQVRASAGADDVPGAARSQRRAGVCLAAACAVFLASGYARGAGTVALVGCGVVLLTLGELLSTASGWGLSYGLSPEARRGEYLALFRWGDQLMNIAGPLCLTALALHRGGWLVAAAVFALAGLTTPPLADAVVRSRTADTPAAADPAVSEKS